ncbi:DEAD/DEAH box helicase [Brevibacterium linens]|uniref:Superfamily II DNA and RNA helicase n=1 Tax=Brevibacterium linens ATCC 9172 TaxID=1255617 RepID=A0A2H1K312_BRELN|nr:DEAD/DEAH box helicase [Brevibacterium linens]KAB1946435.1 DEAD/DEAH box helicase [Brevibacterium linens ATCC 9172]SMX94145.1 Superfamily II DNA and RNA helicase [Brevibacterium linens ATCC 9172]
MTGCGCLPPFHGTGTPSGTSKGHTITTSQTRTNPRTKKATSAPTSFAELGVPAELVDSLDREGKTQAFPIQQDTLPDTLAGRDVLGRGKTGSGKTLAFSIPLVARLAESGKGTQKVRHPRGLVLAPTRELATQITDVIDPLAKAAGLKTTTIFGGVKQRRQENALNAGVDIVVACPGRLEDLLQQDILTLENIEVTILDEADHMADLGFLPGVTRILKQTPAEGQRMFFSATLDNDVDKLVRRFLHNEVLHSVDEATSHVSAMTHHVFEVSVDDKNALVHKLASGTGRRILFTRTKHRAKRFARQLTAAGIPAVDLHGNLSQGARDRNLAAFTDGDAKVLVATDIAARGVHVDSVELVVHVDPPTEHKAYLHRSGRTARAGSAGDVVTVMTPDERKDTQILLRKAAIKASPQKVTADSPEVTELVGEIAEYVAPQPKEPVQPRKKTEPAKSGGRSSRRRRGGRGGRGGGAGRDGAAGESTRTNSRSSDSGRTGQNGRSGEGSRRRETGRGGRSGNQSSGARTSRSGGRRTADSRGTSPETRRRNRSRTGGSQQVYSTSS